MTSRPSDSSASGCRATSTRTTPTTSSENCTRSAKDSKQPSSHRAGGVGNPAAAPSPWSSSRRLLGLPRGSLHASPGRGGQTPLMCSHARVSPTRPSFQISPMQPSLPNVSLMCRCHWLATLYAFCVAAISDQMGQFGSISDTITYHSGDQPRHAPAGPHDLALTTDLRNNPLLPSWALPSSAPRLLHQPNHAMAATRPPSLSLSFPPSLPAANRS